MPDLSPESQLVLASPPKRLGLTSLFLAAVGILYAYLALWCSLKAAETSGLVGFDLRADVARERVSHPPAMIGEEKHQRPIDYRRITAELGDGFARALFT